MQGVTKVRKKKKICSRSSTTAKSSPYYTCILYRHLVPLLHRAVALKLLTLAISAIVISRSTLIRGVGGLVIIVAVDLLVTTSTARHGDSATGLIGVLGATPARLATGAATVGAAAADGKEPEEACGDGKCSGNPHGGQEVGVERAGHTVGLGGTLNCSHDDGSGGCCQCSGGDDGDCGEHANDGCAARKGAAAVGKEAQHNLGGQRDEGDDEDNLSPAGNGTESAHGSLDGVGEGDVLAHGRGDIVDHGLEALSGVGGPVVASLLASFGAIRRDLAVIPQADNVGIGETQVGSSDVGTGNGALDGGSDITSAGSGRGESSSGRRDNVGDITAGGASSAFDGTSGAAHIATEIAGGQRWDIGQTSIT